MTQLEVVHASRVLADQAEQANAEPHRLDQQLGVQETTCLHVSGEAEVQELACRHQAKLVSVSLNRQASVVAQCAPMVNVGEQQVEVMKVKARASHSHVSQQRIELNPPRHHREHHESW